MKQKGDGDERSFFHPARGRPALKEERRGWRSSQSRPRRLTGPFSAFVVSLLPWGGFARPREAREEGRAENDIKKRGDCVPDRPFFYLKMRHSTNALVRVSPTNFSRYMRVYVCVVCLVCTSACVCVYMCVWLIILFLAFSFPFRAVLRSQRLPLRLSCKTGSHTGLKHQLALALAQHARTHSRSRIRTAWLLCPTIYLHLYPLVRLTARR